MHANGESSNVRGKCILQNTIAFKNFCTKIDLSFYSIFLWVFLKFPSCSTTSPTLCFYFPCKNIVPLIVISFRECIHLFFFSTLAQMFQMERDADEVLWTLQLAFQ